MKLSAIGSATLPVYETLLLPEVFQLLQSGELQVALGLVEGNTACGALSGYVSGGAFHLTSLFVAPGFRGRGGGRMLLEGLCAALPPSVVEIQVRYCVTRPDHELLQGFLNHLGFTHLKVTNPVYRSSLSEVTAAPFFAHGGKGKGAIPFCELPPHAIKEAGQRLAAVGPIPFDQPLHLHQLDSDVSMGLLRNGEIASFAVVDHSFGGALTLSYLQASALADPPILLRAIFERAAKKYPQEEFFYFQTIGPASAALVCGLLPSCDVISRQAVLLVHDFTDNRTQEY